MHFMGATVSLPPLPHTSSWRSAILSTLYFSMVKGEVPVLN
jgi:hypothetical protein